MDTSIWPPMINKFPNNQTVCRSFRRSNKHNYLYSYIHTTDIRWNIFSHFATHPPMYKGISYLCSVGHAKKSRSKVNSLRTPVNGQSNITDLSHYLDLRSVLTNNKQSTTQNHSGTSIYTSQSTTSNILIPYSHNKFNKLLHQIY